MTDTAVTLAKLRGGDRRTLARAITRCESTLDSHRREAEALLREAMPYTGASIRVAITGAPGVGKSTFIEAFGKRVIARGHRVAVLTVDPSSAISGGSILGDKTRMETLAANPRAFIRPSSAGQTLGGVARRTFEALLMCEAAGFDFIILETVGVGQSETMAAAMTDVFLLMVSPVGGDELQGIKRGIMELADLIMVNKADGDLRHPAALAAADLQRALALMQRRHPAWHTPVMQVSALCDTGLDEVQEKIDQYGRLLAADGELAKRRRRQAQSWLWNETREQLLAELTKNPAVAAALDGMLEQVGSGAVPATLAAQELVAIFTHAKSSMKSPMKSPMKSATKSSTKAPIKPVI